MAVAEISLAMVLLVTAGLLLRSFAKLTSVSPGFDARYIVTADISLPQFQYSTPQQWAAFSEELLAGVQSEPGLQNSAIAVPRASPDGKTLYFTAGSILWTIPSTGGQALRLAAGDSVVMDPSGRELVVQVRERSGLRLFRVREGGPQQEISLDDSVPLFSPVSRARSAGQNRLLVSLSPRDSWFSRPGIVNTATGRITRVASDNLSDYEYATWTADGHIMVLQVSLRASIWRFRPKPK